MPAEAGSAPFFQMLRWKKEHPSIAGTTEADADYAAII